MTTTEEKMDKPTRPPTWGQPVPTDAARTLRSMTRTITAAERLWDARAEHMADLHARGFSYDAIASAAGITREGARKSVNRWRERRGRSNGARSA